MADQDDKDLSSQQPDTIWFALRVGEFIAIFLINTFTLIVFAGNRQLRRRTSYLIMSLTVGDLLNGAVTGPLEIYYYEYMETEPGFTWKKISILILYNTFPISSLSSLSLISLERLHATLHPLRHHGIIGNLVYFKAIVCSWLLALILACVDSVLHLFIPETYFYAWASHIVVTLLALTGSYITIFVKIKTSPASQRFRAVSTDRKLSATLFIVTVVSILSILPWAIYALIPPGKWKGLSKTTQLHITYAVYVLYYANSLVNPLIYAIRMQSFREAVYKQLICWKKTGGRVQPVSTRIQLQAM